ncbi:DUF6783 domain-containing protein [Anaerobutyricum soehngenii]|uniref:DUF6783 domain-containing protein n=1 Tax=Anaerobutyricum soehngenii TaxID=105843 RepID=UPI002FE6CFCF
MYSRSLLTKSSTKRFREYTRACLKNHSSNLHASIYGIFCLHSVDVARYAALIQAKSPVNCNAHLAESIFQTSSRACRLQKAFFKQALERKGGKGCLKDRHFQKYFQIIRFLTI